MEWVEWAFKWAILGWLLLVAVYVVLSVAVSFGSEVFKSLTGKSSSALIWVVCILAAVAVGALPVSVVSIAERLGLRVARGVHDWTGVLAIYGAFWVVWGFICLGMDTLSDTEPAEESPSRADWAEGAVWFLTPIIVGSSVWVLDWRMGHVGALIALGLTLTVIAIAFMKDKLKSSQKG
jgi:hypothetical protein